MPIATGVCLQKNTSGAFPLEVTIRNYKHVTECAAILSFTHCCCPPFLSHNNSQLSAFVYDNGNSYVY